MGLRGSGSLEILGSFGGYFTLKSHPFEDYWIWRKKALGQLRAVHKHLAVIAGASAGYLAACTDLKSSTEHVLPAKGLQLWINYREAFF